MNLDTNIRGIPLKYWLLIAVGGVGIGYLVTRNSGETAPKGVLPAQLQQVKDSNKLNALVSVENMRRESVLANYESYTGKLQQQAQAAIDTLISVEKATPVVNPPTLRLTPPNRPKPSTDSIRQQIPRSTITSLV